MSLSASLRYANARRDHLDRVTWVRYLATDDDRICVADHVGVELRQDVQDATEHVIDQARGRQYGSRASVEPVPIQELIT